MLVPAADRGIDSAASASTSGRGGPNINPVTGLSTNYLNHFTESVVRRTRELVLQLVGSAEIDAIVRRGLDRLRPLIARTAPVINRTAVKIVDRYGPQATVDAIFDR